MAPERKALLQIHFCVLLWGFTAILGKLISLPALGLVWWRMLIVVVVLLASWLLMPTPKYWKPFIFAASLAFYAAADVAFVAGSLVPVGGHNLLEPAVLGLPMLSGPHTQNAQDVAELLQSLARDGRNRKPRLHAPKLSTPGARQRVHLVEHDHLRDVRTADRGEHVLDDSDAFTQVTHSSIDNMQ